MNDTRHAEEEGRGSAAQVAEVVPAFLNHEDRRADMTRKSRSELLISGK